MTLRDEIERDYVVERTGWAAERAARVCDRLQRDVPVADRLEAIVVWFSEHTAFTTFGDTIYLGRRLLERLPDDDAAAFIVAHELAHHRLGHIPHHAMSLVPARLVLAALGSLVCRPHRETHADLLAIEMCIAAGFDADRCIAALEILTLVSLDYGDVDGVLGSDRKRSHPALARRIAAIRDHVAAIQGGAHVDIRQAIANDRRRRRNRGLAIMAGSAAAGLAVAVFRRWPR